jgi:hypothetical protein
MNRYTIHSVIFWAMEAGAAREQSKRWMAEARIAVGDRKCQCVRHARRYHHEYLKLFYQARERRTWTI